eukprot:EG_transcript_2320
MAHSNNVTLHVGGTEFSTPTDGLMALLRGIQVKKGSGDPKGNADLHQASALAQEEATVKQQQILQLQNQLRLLQQLSQPPQQQQQLKAIQALQQSQQAAGQSQQLQQLFLQQFQQQPATLPTLIAPLQTTQVQAAVQQQLQLQQLLQLQQQRTQQQQQQQQQIQLQRQLLQQQMAQQQLLQLQQQQQLQLQLQEHFRRQQEQVQVAKPPSALENAQLNLMQAKGLSASQFTPVPVSGQIFPSPSLPTKPDPKIVQAPTPPASMDVNQKLQLLHQLQQLGVQHKVTLAQPTQPSPTPPPPPPPAESPSPGPTAPDVAKTNLLLSMLGGKPEPSPEPPASGKGPDAGIDIFERLRADRGLSDADGKGKVQKRLLNNRGSASSNADGSEGVNSNKTGLLCSLLGVHNDKPAPPPAAAPASAASAAALDLLKALPQLSSIQVVPAAQPAALDTAVPPFGVPPSVIPLSAVSTSMAPVVLPGAVPQPSQLSLAASLLSHVSTTGAGPLMQQVNAPVNSIALPFASSTTVPPLASSISLQGTVEPTISGAAADPIAGLVAQLKRAEPDGNSAPQSEVAPVIKALQLHQVLAQAGAGPAKFSHVSSTTTSAAAPVNTVTTSTSSHESNLVVPDKGQEEAALMRIQAGEQGITDFQWLVNLVNKRSKEAPPIVPAAGLGTWLHTEGKEPTPLASGPPPVADTAPPRPKVSRQTDLDKKVYSHNFLKDLQFCKAAGTTPSLIPRELIRDPDDDRRRPSNSGYGRPYDEHDHRSRDSPSDDERDGGWGRGDNRARGRLERRWR